MKMAAKKKPAPRKVAKTKKVSTSASTPAKTSTNKTTTKSASQAAPTPVTQKSSGKTSAKQTSKPELKTKTVAKVKKTTTRSGPVKSPAGPTATHSVPGKDASGSETTGKAGGGAMRKEAKAQEKSPVKEKSTAKLKQPDLAMAAAKAKGVGTIPVAASEKGAAAGKATTKEKSTDGKKSAKSHGHPVDAETPEPQVVESPKTKKKPSGAKSGVKQDVTSKAQKTDNKTIVAKNTARIIELQEPAYTPSTGPIHGIAPYQPKPGEDYMSEGQLEHFQKILNNWKKELMEEVDRTIHHLRDEATNFPDPNDRATQESEFGLELRARDRERKLLKKIDAALERIEDGSYGYCEETGEEIGLRRLEARPIATLCLEAQERHELAERHYGEREDRYR